MSLAKEAAEKVSEGVHFPWADTPVGTYRLKRSAKNIRGASGVRKGMAGLDIPVKAVKKPKPN